MRLKTRLGIGLGVVAVAAWAAVAGGGPAGAATDAGATAATVTLKASAPRVVYGGESAETLTPTVSSPAGGTPTGIVSVTGVDGAVCTITLTVGTGTCALTAEQLAAGNEPLTGTYGGDASYASASETITISVAPAATVTSMRYTPGTITFTGVATTLAVTGSVTSTAGTPNGWVTVRIDGKAVAGCTNVSFIGTMSCKGTTAILTGGTHWVSLGYAGRGNFAAAPTSSSSFALPVGRRHTTASLTLARTSVTYGHESAEKFTVSASHVGSVYPTGKVQVRIGGTTICTITLSRGVGSCTLANTRLRAGTYTFVDLYSGDRNYYKSESAKKTLKVVG